MVQTLELQLVRNATIKLRVGGKTLLIDPYLCARSQGLSYAGAQRSPLVDLPFSVASILEGVDAVFVSHLHSDHFDLAAKAALPSGIPIYCPAMIAPAIRSYGFSRVTGIVSTVQWDGIVLEVTPGRHGPQDVLLEMGAVNGVVIWVSNTPVLYWVGDSVWCTEVHAVISDRKPSHIVVHACGATWHGHGPLVMDQHHVESVLRNSAGAHVVATHMDCVDHATVSRESLARHFDKLPSLRSRLSVPADGDLLRLPWRSSRLGSCRQVC